MNRRGSSAELEASGDIAMMDPWDSFDIEAGPKTQTFMRGASPSFDGMTPEGDTLIGDEAGALNLPPGTEWLDGRWRPGVGMGPVQGYRLERRGNRFRYVRARKPNKRRRPRRYQTPGASPPPAQQYQPEERPPEPTGMSPEEAPGAPMDGVTPPPATLDPNLAALLAMSQQQRQHVEITDEEPQGESVEGFLSDLFAPTPYGSSPGLQAYGPPGMAQRPSAPYGAPAPQPQSYGQPYAPQPQPQPYGVAPYGQPPQPQGYAVKGDGVGYWTELTTPGSGTRLLTPEWTEIGTIGEAIERMRAVVRDFRALPGLGGTGTAPEPNAIRETLYRAITSGRMTRSRAYDVAREYGQKYGEALSLIAFIDEIDDDENLINRVANQVRDRVNDCRNLIRNIGR